MSFLEAIRVGTIAIVADFGNFNREIVEKGKFGYVIHYNDIDTFANRIVDICKNLQNYMELYDNAYNTYLKELNYKIWKERMDNLIYTEGCIHIQRDGELSIAKLRKEIIKLKLLTFESNIERSLFEDLKVLFRMWRLKKKTFIRNNY